MMENLKKIWNELLEKYKGQKLELLLLLVLFIVSIGFGIHDIAEETPVSSTVSFETENGSQESEENTEESREDQSEDGVMPKENGQESDTDESDVNENDEDETTEESRDGTGKKNDQDGAWEESGEDRDSKTELIEDSEEETDSEDEAQETAKEANGNLFEKEDISGSRENLAVLNMPENDTQDILIWHTLEDTRELYEYKLLIPEKNERKFVELNLEDILKEKISGYDGDWSVYVKNLETGEELLINDRPMKSASVMKLFIMGTVYKAFENGELDRTDEIMTLMNEMITYSDNEASNQLLYRLGHSDYARGIARVNAFIQEYDFSSMTVEYNGFNDPATVMGTGNYNQVSARDCGRLLEAIYRREWVSRNVSNEIEQMMMNQQTRYKIPAGLPEGVACGNKTGEMDTTENDAAVIYGEDCDYILVVLSSDWNSKDEAVSRIKSISSTVYRYLNAE